MTLPVDKHSRPETARRKGTHYERHTISLPPAAADFARADMQARGIPTFSEYVQTLVRERASEKSLRQVLEEMLGDQPVTPEEREWARRAFGD